MKHKCLIVIGKSKTIFKAIFIFHDAREKVEYCTRMYSRFDVHGQNCTFGLRVSTSANRWMRGKNRWFTLRYYQRHATRNRDKLCCKETTRLFRGFFTNGQTFALRRGFITKMDLANIINYKRRSLY